MSKIKITLIKSLIGEKEKARETIQSLGLKKINSSTTRELNDSLDGMLRKVGHLIKIEEVN
tara:strand:- start:3216 stop:3398 length:183 start_codon:yes stop_codon:yes gene_type:complete